MDKTYLVLKVAQGDLTVRAPADSAEFVGVRDAVGQDGLDRVFEVLRAPYTEEPELVPSLQGKPGEARLRRCHQGRGSRA